MNFYEKLTKKNTSPLIMAIVNITPDSFYDGGKYNDKKNCIKHIEKLINEGADIIDIGACSSRPGSSQISIKEEESRLIPILEKVKTLFPETIISVDTYRYQIAKKAIELGADIINDIYVEYEKEKKFSLIQKHNISYVLMHMIKSPVDMQKNITYDDFELDILNFFKKHVKELKNRGFNNIILDPGIGFGKTIDQNYILINMLPKICQIQQPVLMGTSRKSFIYNTLKTTPKNALTGTIVTNTICLMNGAKIIRVHDVKEAKETVKIINLIKQNHLD